ncbi:metal-dependent transcriptional regulator [Facklamia sp. DSM 111018]|uniref:Manganese transport regulator n=1 Tax=Facklamia lactis TaxID=2749967 RepID=A0ABS0LQQ0_9LACT|nr:metal-dependent transcriptional regulator [Facklamia lactis]MBG9980542.1 metal-dependent transcriptional regulator [Facklamia lactis]MBG9986334.1 metal-dependent transcriptional regulator [Facklamia lactis]
MKQSNVKENYLKTIFLLKGYQLYISNKLISQALNVSAPSVTEMTNRLAKEKLVESISYKGVILTKKGLSIAIKTVKRHRLAELFLYKVLNYKLSEVHDDAEVLEHLESDFFFEKLEILLDHPQFCPHGGIIPRLNQYEEIYQTPLTHYKTGDIVTVCRCLDQLDLLKFLDSIQLNIGDTITIQNIEETNQIISFSYNDHRTGNFSFETAELIYCEKANESSKS